MNERTLKKAIYPLLKEGAAFPARLFHGELALKLTITFLAALLLAGCDNMNSEPPDIQMMREMRPIGSTKDLNVDLKLAVGNIEIGKVSEDELFSFDLQYDRRHYDPRFKFDEGDHASMSLDVNGHTGPTSGSGQDNDLTLRLTDKVPLDLDISAGVSESRLELGALQLKRLRLRGGVGKTEITFDKESPIPMESFEVDSGVGELVVHGLGNTHVGRVEFKGGVGHADLDFTGDLGMTRTDATIHVGVGSIRLTIPREADVELEGAGSFLSNISAPSFDHNGHTYTHHGNGGATMHIHVLSGIGGVHVELI
jgi:hypothetical protein